MPSREIKKNTRSIEPRDRLRVGQSSLSRFHIHNCIIRDDAGGDIADEGGEREDLLFQQEYFNSNYDGEFP